MTASTALTTAEPRTGKSITTTVANRYGMDAAPFEATLRQTVFKEGSQAEFAAFLVVADQHKLNPLTKEIYGFKAKGGGIQPVVSIDGWSRIINERAELDGVEFNLEEREGKPYAMTCRIYRKDRSRPTEITEYFDECVQNTDPWRKTGRRMLRHRALIQCARVAFGFSGIMDEDEYQRWIASGSIDGEATVVAQPAKSLGAGFGAGSSALPAPKADEGERDARSAADPGGTKASATAASDASAAAPSGPKASSDQRSAGSPEGDKDPSGEASQSQASSSASPEADAIAQHTDAGGTADKPKGKAARKAGEDKPWEAPVLPGPAPWNTVYHLVDDTALDADGKRATYKDGQPFSRAGAKGALNAYTSHPISEIQDEDDGAEFEDTAAGEAVDDDAAAEQDDEPAFPGDLPPPADDAPAADDVDRTKLPFNVFATALPEAKSWQDVSRTLLALMRTPDWKDADPEGRKMAYLDAWERAEQLVEGGVALPIITNDMTLFRCWLESEEAKDYAALRAKWKLMVASEVYKHGSEGQKDSLATAVNAQLTALKAK